MGSHRSVSRRGFLTTVAGTAATAAAAGTAAAQASFDGWMSDVGNYSEVTDATGEDEVTVTVGAEGNGGAFAFDPPAVQVDPGTTIVWEWTGEGGQHNVVAEEGGDFESETTAEAGFTFEQTFDSEGVVKYFCQPHRGLGMKGVVVVGEMPDSGGGGGGGGGGSAAPALPESAKALAIALTTAMVSVLALAYFFIRYGGDYGEDFESA
ncbi:halocyanin domain-containing protein [Haloplanus sp. C73]|uniref:halocyanin domain-containing protein n=1 Tax=Haloplanus sp. C73 TaxID=3421641 RepID=UPI003EBD6DBD